MSGSESKRCLKAQHASHTSNSFSDGKGEGSSCHDLLRSEYTGKILGWDSPSLSLAVASNTGSARGFLRGLVRSLLGAGATLVQPGQSRPEDEWDRELRKESHFHGPGGDCGGGG